MIKKGKPQLTSKNLERARNMLYSTIKFFDNSNIAYHLEGGTLLGIVRDGDLLPWDHDIDLSIPSSEVDKLLKARYKLYLKGFKVTIRKSSKQSGPFEKDQIYLFKIKKLIPSIIKFVYPWYAKNYVVLDVFVKVTDGNDTYWRTEIRLLKVDKKHYQSFESLNYMGYKVKIPNDYKEYLTQKYGDWSIPVKDWECHKNEGTICENLQ